MNPIGIGQKVVNFSLPATGNQTLSLENFQGHKVVLFFYPRDNTPGCTSEGQEFRDLHDEFLRQNARVLGISRDSLKSHENFREKYQFPFDLLADTEEIACRQFDVIKEKNLYGKKVMGIERSTFLIDEAGVLRREWRKVKVNGHAREVLDAIQDL